MEELAYVNGVFGPIAEAKVSIEDRGYQFGDGIYEVALAYDGAVFLLEPHLVRLRNGLSQIGLEYDFDANPLEPIIREGLSRCGIRDVMIYIQITRGVAPRNHAVPQGLTPTVVMTFKPSPIVPEAMRREGVALKTTREIRWANCYIKAITLLPNVLAKTDAVRQGYHDALFVTEEGEVRECTSANVFMVSDGQLKTPPLTESVLHGITQAFVFECAAGIGYEADQSPISIDTLRGADEVFLSGTAVEVLPVTSIDGKPIADGKVGPVSQRMYDEFWRRAKQELAKAREQVANRG